MLLSPTELRREAALLPIGLDIPKAEDKLGSPLGLRLIEEGDGGVFLGRCSVW